MKKMKLLIVMVAIVALMSSLLVACGDGSNNKESGKKNNNTGTTNSTTNKSESGSDEKEGTKPDEPKPIVKLKAIFPGDAPQGFDAVLQAVNDKLKADNIGAALNIQFIPWSDYGSATSVKIAAQEDLDMYLDAPWLHMNQLIASGSLLELDNLVAARQDLVASIPDMMWEANKYNGKIMGIPLGTTQGLIYGFKVRKDLREKYGLPEIKTLDDMVKFLYTVKEKDKGMIPFVLDGRQAGHNAWRFNKQYYSNEWNGFAVTNEFLALDNKQIVPVWERPGYEHGYTYSAQFYKDGIFDKNIMQEQNAVTLFNQGKAASTAYYSDGVVNYLDLFTNVPGAELEIVVPAEEGWKPLSDFKQWNFLCIPAYSKNAEIVMDVMNWLSIKENHDLLEYGIEGTDWKAVGDTGYEAISGYAFPGYVLTWRPMLTRTPSNMNEGDKKWFDFAKDATQFRASVTTGFTANLDGVKTEVAKITPLNEQIIGPVAAGVLDYEKGIAQYKKEMEKEGYKKIQEALQAQLDEFLASK